MAWLRTSDTRDWPPPRERHLDLALAGHLCPLCQHLFREVSHPTFPQLLCHLGFHLTHGLHSGARGLKGGLEVVVGFALLLLLQESSGGQEELVLHPEAGEGGEEEGNQSLPVPLEEVVAGEVLTLGHGKTREAVARVEVEVAPKAVVEAEVEERRGGGGVWTLGGAGQGSRAGAVVGRAGVEVGAPETTGEEARMGSPGPPGRQDRAQERR